MLDILHRVGINATAEKVYKALFLFMLFTDGTIASLPASKVPRRVKGNSEYPKGI
jgi:hypothetical protein